MIMELLNDVLQRCNVLAVLLTRLLAGPRTSLLCALVLQSRVNRIKQHGYDETRYLERNGVGFSSDDGHWLVMSNALTAVCLTSMNPEGVVELFDRTLHELARGGGLFLP